MSVLTVTGKVVGINHGEREYQKDGKTERMEFNNVYLMDTNFTGKPVQVDMTYSQLQRVLGEKVYNWPVEARASAGKNGALLYIQLPKDYDVTKGLIKDLPAQPKA